MKKYYIVKNNTQQGPYTIEELKDINISKSTLTWTEGMDEWTNAENIDELKEVLMKKPPPTPSSANTNTKKKLLLGKSKAIIALILFSILLIYVGFKDISSIKSTPISVYIDIHKTTIENMAKNYHWYERPSQDEFIERVVEDITYSIRISFYLIFVGLVLLFIGILLMQRKFFKHKLLMKNKVE